jgi:WD40 repeat protein
VIQRFGAFENGVGQIAFSADGRRIAVGLGGNNGVRVLDSATGAELMADREYGDGVYGVAFASDGGLIASSDDSQLRRYEPDLKLAMKSAAPDGRNPYGVSIDPSGRRVAVGYTDRTSVSILDARTLAPIARAQTGDLTNGNLFSVAWSRDGATLVSGGQAQAQLKSEWHVFLRRFDKAGRRKGADVAASAATIFDIQPCRDGFAFTAGDPAFGLLSTRGVATTLQGPRTADMRDKLGSAFALSPDAASVRFGLSDREERPVLFDLAAASLTDSPSLSPRFLTAKVDGLPVTDWRNNLEPRFNGAKIALDNYETSEVLAIRPDTSGFALGSDFWVRAYDGHGKERWKQPGPGVAWGVDFSADGEILAVAYLDGTIRWLRWSDGQELLAFFVEPQTRKWVAWTPSGYYMASAGGEDLIGWHVNRGWSQEADFFPASQFRAEYNRPDIVRLVLHTRDEAEAIRRANETAQRAAAKPIAAALPPVVTVTSPADGFRFSGSLVEIDYSLRSPSGQPIDRLDVLADGQRLVAVGFEKTTAAETKGRVVTTPPKKDTTLSLIAYSGGLTSNTATINLKYSGPNAPPELPKPKLYALLVGVTGYENPDYKLEFPAQDAVSFAKALEAQKGGLFGDVQTKVVADANQHSVFEGLDWLHQATTSGDLAVVFLAGHGFVDPKKRFWFLTREADTGRLRTTAVSNDDLFDSIASIPGKKVLFLDACYAAAALTSGTRALETTPDMNKIVNDFSTAGSGVVVYAASMGTEFSKEDPKLGHGAFSEALIEAIGEGATLITPPKPPPTAPSPDSRRRLSRATSRMTCRRSNPISNARGRGCKSSAPRPSRLRPPRRGTGTFSATY